MKSNTKSSITLPPHELALVEGLRKRLRAKSKVEVVRRGLYLLRDSVERDALRARYAEASKKVRASTLEAIAELDGLSAEGLDEDE
jgi:Arc/MetJ-type ribon-helix-helix transcriptional regulator